MRKKDVDRQIAFDAAADALRRVHEPSMSRTGRAPAPASTASARSSPSTCRSACSSLSSTAVGATGASVGMIGLGSPTDVVVITSLPSGRIGVRAYVLHITESYRYSTDAADQLRISP